MANQEYVPFTGKLDAATEFEPFNGTLDGQEPSLTARVKQGVGRAVDSAQAALTDSPSTIAHIAAQQARNALPQTEKQQRMAQEMAPYVDAANKSEGVVDTVKTWGAAGFKRAGQLMSNPGEAGKMIAEQLPNSLPGLAGGFAGAKLGAMAGTAVAPGVGTVVGGILGGVAGGFAGGYGLEKGSAMLDQVQKEAQARQINLQDESSVAKMVAEKQPEFEAAAQRKGVGTAGTDAVLNVATMGLAGMGGRTLAKEAHALSASVKAGTISATDAATELARLQAANAARNTLGAKALRHSGVAGAEMAGEGFTEGVGQKYAYGSVDAGDVIDESLLGLGTGAAMAMSGKAFNKAAGIVDQDATTRSLAATQEGLRGLVGGNTPPPAGTDGWTTSPGVDQAPGPDVPPPEAPDFTTSPGAAPERTGGMDYQRDISTDGLSLVDAAAQDRARAATVDFGQADTTPGWDTSPGAAPPRVDGIDMGREFDTSGLELDNRLPSERMGINPNAGPLSRAATIAVDSTPAQEATFIGRTARDLQAYQPKTGIENDNVIDVQGRVVDDRTISIPRRIEQGGPANRIMAAKMARDAGPGHEVVAVEGGYAVQKTAPNQPLLPAPLSQSAINNGAVNVQNTAPAADPQAQAAPAQAPEAARGNAPAQTAAVPAAGTGGVQAAGVAGVAPQSPQSTPKEIPNGTQADQAQQAAPQRQETPAQPAPAVERHPNWRKNAIQAGRVAKSLGIDPKGKRLAQMVEEIEAADSAQNQAPALATPAQSATENVAPAPGSTRIGRDQRPLAEGGKPFKTRKAAGDAKKLQPMMRVVSVPGGYALAEKTHAQLAAEERAAKRLRTPRTSPAGEPVPAHAFIAASGGLHMRHRNDLGVDGNPRIGNRRLFGGLNRGLSVEQATEMLVADGYLSEGASHNDAYALIKKSLSQPQYNADGIERIAQAESDAQFEDYLAAQEEAAADGDTDPFGMADEFTAEELDEVGYTDADPALQAEVAALIAQAEAMGIDTYAILEDIARTYANATQDQYNAAAREALAAAIARSNQDGGSVAAQAAPAAEPATEQGLNQPEAPAALELAAQTQAEAAARQDAQEQAAKAEAAAKRAEDAAAKAEDERKRIAQASVRAADRFELGQDPLDSLTGQGSVFDAPEPEQQAPTTAVVDDDGRERFTLSIEMFGDVPYRASKPVDAGNGDVVSSRVITTKTRLTAANAQLLGLPKDKGTVYAWRVSVIRRADGTAHSVIEAMATDNGRSPDGEVLAHFKEVENPEAMERIAPAIANAALSDWRAAQPQQAPTTTEEVAAQPITRADAEAAKPIEDAGEKIGGARKDRWKERGLNLDDLDAMTEAEGAELATKANVWKPDYEALAAQSEPVSAAMTKVIYDRLAAKPKKNTPEGRRQYVQMMRIVRDVLTDAKGPDAVRTAYLEIRNRAGLNTNDPQAKAAARELLFSAYKGRSDPFVLDGGDLMKVKKMVTDGFPAKGEPWKTRLTVGRAEGGPGSTERGIELYVERSAEVGTPLTREQILDGFYRVTTKDNKTVAFAPTKADAEAAAATVYERDMKGKKDGKPEPVRPNLDELKRENLPQRIDRDVKADDFVNDLGFRGIEFGNWSAQDERQRILNMAYDGLMDLAEIMGVPPKAMSLNGTLGMAFGARGGGRFAAHYEPGKLVINMTKIRGGGSMAHEWAHAMDHYFGELNKDDAYTTTARGASGWYSEDQYLGVPRKRMERVGNEWKNVEKMRLDNLRPEMAAAFDEVMRGLFSKQVTKAEMIRSHELDLERTEALARNEAQADLKAMYQNMVQNKRQALNELRGDPEGTMYAGRGRSDYASQAQELSGKSENGYWTRPTEMFARAFESWVFDKVTAMGARSDYLVHGVEEDRFAGGGYKGNPYPAGEERARINAAYDKLASTIKTKETDKGVAMFSRSAGEDGKSSVLSKNGTFKGWPRYNSWTRAEYNDVVSLLPADYRNDPHRREPLSPADRDARAAAALPQLNAGLTKRTFTVDQLGNIAVDARDAGVLGLKAAAKIADQHGLGIYVTGVQSGQIKLLQDAGFVSEAGLGMILQRAAKTNSAPMPTPFTTMGAPAYGAIMSYRPRGFSQVMFSFGDQNATRTAARKASDARLVATQQLVDGLREKWTNAPEIIVARDMQDGQIPQSVRDYDQTLKSQGATGEARGFIYQGKVYLLADQLNGPHQIAEVLFHEVLGHYGLRRAFGKGLTPILQQVATMRRKEMQAKAKEYGLDLTNERDRLTAAEEILAEMAQATPEIGFVKRAIAVIRNWMRANVPGFQSLRLTDNDIIQAYILPARSAVTRSKETGLQSLERAMAAFSRTAGDQTQTEAFKRWFGGSKAVDTEGKPLVVYHGTNADFNAFDPGKLGMATGAASARKGFFFASNPKTGGYYATGNPRLDDLRRRVNAAQGSQEGSKLLKQLVDLQSDIKRHTTGQNPITQRMAEVRRQLSRYAIDISRDMTAKQERDEWGHVDQSPADERWQLIQEYKTLREQERAAGVEVGIGENGRVIPVYLSIKNPLVYDYKGRSYRDKSYAEILQQAIDGGHDGVILRNTYDSGPITHAARDETDIYVVFRPEQIKSATGNNGDFDPANPDIRFSRAAPGGIAARVGESLKSVTATNIKERAGFKLTDYLGLGLQLLGRRQLVDIYGDTLPLDQYNRLAQQMEADKNEVGAEADALATAWAKLPDERQLAELMHDATLAQMDPAKPLVAGDNAVQYGVLRKRFNDLTPEAQKVYLGARDSYQAHHKGVLKAIKERIERSELKGPRKAALLAQMDDEFYKAVKGVYFPLARFGRYVVVTTGPDGKVANVSRAETMNEGQATRKQMLLAFPASKGYKVGKVILSKEFVAGRDAVGRGFMTELYAVLDKQDMDSAARAELEDTLGQLYLSSLPDLSWAKHGIHRKGTPGYSQDARRAFAQNMFHGARYLAKLRYSDLMQDELTAMQKHVDDWVEVPDADFNSARAQRVVDEFNKRHEAHMNPKSNPLSTALTSFGFIFHLGLSPASALVNLTQTALVAYPVMGAKWGFDKSAAALMKASQQAVQGKNDITGSLNEEERRAYDEAVRNGTIDVTMAHDLAGISQGEDAGVMWKIRPVMKWASFMFHHAERFNRQVTFVASYRLAREAGAAHEAAFEQATKATYDGHFDYSSANRPRVMQGNAARVLLLFKQYGQNMVYSLARSAQQSLKGATPQERTEARRVLGGLLAMHGMAAGALGLPMVTTLLAVASMLGGSDDEPWDAQVALQNMLADTFGQKPAEVLSHGLSRLTPWDISGRVGLDKLILPDIQEGLEGQRLGESAMAAALGPVAGIGINVLRGMQDMGNGHYLRGLESMLPAALRGPMKALRYADEGAQDKTGVSIQDEVSPAAIAGQAFGFSPSEVRLATEGKSAIMGADRALNERRSHLVTQFAMAVMAGDADGQQEARAAVAKFNEKNPERRILPMQLAQSVRNRQKRIDQSEGGVYLPKKHQGVREAGRFATEESSPP